MNNLTKRVNGAHSKAPLVKKVKFDNFRKIRALVPSFLKLP